MLTDARPKSLIFIFKRDDLITSCSIWVTSNIDKYTYISLKGRGNWSQVTFFLGVRRQNKKIEKVFKLCLQNLAAQLISAAYIHRDKRENKCKNMLARHASNRDKKRPKSCFHSFILNFQFRL